MNIDPAISANVPMLIRACLNEMGNGINNPTLDSFSDAHLLPPLRPAPASPNAAPPKTPDIIAAYRREYPKEPPLPIWAAIAAAGMRHNAGPAYQYVYALAHPVLDGRPGSFHSSEIAFVFDNADLRPRYSGGPEALALSSEISRRLDLLRPQPQTRPRPAPRLARLLRRLPRHHVLRYPLPRQNQP